MSIWLYRLAVLAHIAGVVVWMGAVAYYLLVLRPALHMSGIERKATYPLLAAIKVRLRWVVGGAILVIVASGAYNAQRRGLLGPSGGADEVHRHVFWWKMAIVLALILIYIFALPLLARVRTGKVRGRLFVLVHMVVLTLGTLAAAAGVFLSR
ncbi:MAG TPA: hypothetical protein VFT57_09805 [Gemmatimonadaceae bacterium]|nr:hypothetical protein [Gemmatimonadaceae bacterium]